MSHVFISYQHESYDFVNSQLVPRLEKIHFTVWWDERIQPGHKDWREEIDEKIRTALAVVVVMTPEAKASEYVTYEWSLALGLNKTVIPIVLRESTFHPRLMTHHRLDFTKPKGRPWKELTRVLKEIVENSTAPAQTHVIEREMLVSALAELIYGKSLEQTGLNVFLQYDLLSHKDISSILKAASRKG